MKKVSIQKFRRNAKAVIRKVCRGQRLIVTYRGKPVMRLEPIQGKSPGPDDPFYKLAHLAEADRRRLTNEKIDQIVY